jgi:hypothetical protein
VYGNLPGVRIPLPTPEILSWLNVPKLTERLQICSGNITTHIHFWAYHQGYQYSSIPASNQPQILLDTEVFLHLREDIDLKNVDFEMLPKVTKRCV